MPRYPILLEEYRRRLEGRVANNEIVEDTLNTHLNDANRIFEALIYGLPNWLIKACLSNHRFESVEQYDKVINDLKEIANERARDA